MYGGTRRLGSGPSRAPQPRRATFCAAGLCPDSTRKTQTPTGKRAPVSSLPSCRRGRSPGPSPRRARVGPAMRLPATVRSLPASWSAACRVGPRAERGHRNQGLRSAASPGPNAHRPVGPGRDAAADHADSTAPTWAPPAGGVPPFGAAARNSAPPAAGSRRPRNRTPRPPWQSRSRPRPAGWPAPDPTHHARRDLRAGKPRPGTAGREFEGQVVVDQRVPLRLREIRRAAVQAQADGAASQLIARQADMRAGVRDVDAFVGAIVLDPVAPESHLTREPRAIDLDARHGDGRRVGRADDDAANDDLPRGRNHHARVGPAPPSPS